MTYTIYSKNGCAFCEEIKLLFDLEEIKYVEYLLDRDFSKEQFYDEFGDGTTFPRIVDSTGMILGGAKDTIRYLQENNLCCNV